jgi:hypothetical protein
MGQPAAVGVDARARECGAHRRCFEGRGLQQHSVSPLCRDGSTCVDGSTVYTSRRPGGEDTTASPPPVLRGWQYCTTPVDGPGTMLPTVLVDHQWVGPSHRPSTGAWHHVPRLPAPSRPASAARALDHRRAGSPARTQTTAIVRDTSHELRVAEWPNAELHYERRRGASFPHH